MAGINQRFVADGKWYDPDNKPGELHDDLRLDYAAARRNALRRPSVRRHMESCEVCQSIGAATAAAPNPLSTRKRMKLVLNAEQMHTLLRLPANFEIVHMFAQPDPNTVSILVAGEGLPEVDYATETPIARIDSVADDAALKCDRAG
jgi:hypothetical protein